MENAGLFGFAKQKMENPVSSGNIHSGKSSQIKILSVNESDIHTFKLAVENLRAEYVVKHSQLSPCRLSTFVQSIEH